MARHLQPDEIVPIDNQENLLLAIHDELVAIRKVLSSSASRQTGTAPAGAVADDGVVTETEASSAGRSLAAHKTQTRKTTARKKSTTTRKKSA